MTTPKSNSQIRFYAFLFTTLLVQAIWIINSDGFYFIDDSCHYNYNVHFLSTLEYSVSFWHRLGRVLLFFLPSQLGLKGAQITSSAIFTLTYLISYKILKIKGVKYAEWVIPSIAFQPLLFNVSYTVLAELPAGFLFILSYYFFLKDKPYATIITASSIFLFRTELYFIAGIYFIIYFFRKKYFVLPWIIIAPLFWFIMSFIFTGDLNMFFYNMGLHSRLPRISEGVQWYHYFEKSPKIFGILQTLGFILALWLITRRRQIKDYYIPLIFVFGGIIINTLFALDELNLSCSIGQLRYVVPAGPALGLISVLGSEFLFKKIENKKKLLTAVTILIFFLMFITGPFTTPYHKKYEIEKFAEKIAKLHEEQYPDYIVISAMHQVATAMNEPATGKTYFQTMKKSNILENEKAIIVWEKYLESSPFTEEMIPLRFIESLPNIKLIDSVNVLIDHDTDYPMYNILYGKCERLNKAIKYFISEQNTWEDLKVKVFIKD
ncbi:MAG: hypothetical protein JW917_00245 [Ignavibacteria bacterium]|nr:hypothetical protein [Ignavibacteria bacterium]